jgi:hypothetical protein
MKGNTRNIGGRMLRFIEGLPPGVLGVEAVGKVTRADYRETLVPRAEAMMRDGPVPVLYLFGPDFDGYEPGAMWDDAVFGIDHWRRFARVAVVGDQAWLRPMVGLFRALMPCPVRIFPASDLAAAKAWVAEKQVRRAS